MSCSADSPAFIESYPQSYSGPGRYQLSLAFACGSQEKTYLSHQYCSYPFHICRAQYLDPEQSDIATVYLQSCSGGIFSGDNLNSTITVEKKARAHVTTQSSTVVHSMPGGQASQCVKIVAEAESYIEFLPDPMILFPRANMCSAVDITLHPRATVLICDGFLPHDPGRNQEPFGRLESTIRAASPEQKILFVDHFELDGADFRLQALGMQGKHKVHANFILLTQKLDPRKMCDAMQAAIENNKNVYGGVSELPNNCGIGVRLIAVDGTTMRSAVSRVWSTARKLFTGTIPPVRKK
jgi:urease accessory protein